MALFSQPSSTPMTITGGQHHERMNRLPLQPESSPIPIRTHHALFANKPDSLATSFCEDHRDAASLNTWYDASTRNMWLRVRQGQSGTQATQKPVGSPTRFQHQLAGTHARTLRISTLSPPSPRSPSRACTSSLPGPAPVPLSPQALRIKSVTSEENMFQMDE